MSSNSDKNRSEQAPRRNPSKRSESRDLDPAELEKVVGGAAPVRKGGDPEDGGE